MTIDEARDALGQKVVYRSSQKAEEGVITSVTNHFVFVRYGADYGSKATSPGDLELMGAR